MLKSVQKFFGSKKNLYILIQDCEGIGYRGEILKIKNSLARGILLPQKRAVYYTKGRHQRLFKSKDMKRAQSMKKKDAEIQYLKKIQQQIKINQEDNYLNDMYLKDPIKGKIKSRKFNRKSKHKKKNKNKQR